MKMVKNEDNTFYFSKFLLFLLIVNKVLKSNLSLPITNVKLSFSSSSKTIFFENNLRNMAQTLTYH